MMRYSLFLILFLVGATIFVTSCNDDEESCTETLWYEDADEDGLGNPDVSLSSCEQPTGYVADNSDTNDTGTNLTPEPVIAARMTPGRIGGNQNFTLTVPTAPELAATSTATGLGPIGIAVSGVPIFNDTEGPNRPLEEEIAQTFDYAGAHNGPSGYHYHIESSDVPENTVLSHDDEKLVGIMSDGFLIYGRKEMDGSYPTDLDESGGHFGVTTHSNGEEIYHYHIINEFYLGNLVVLFGGDLQGTPNSIF